MFIIIVFWSTTEVSSSSSQAFMFFFFDLFKSILFFANWILLPFFHVL